MDEDDIQLDGETVVLGDDSGRTLTCTIERYLEVESQEYALLLPVDSPVEIFAWQGEDEEEEEAIPVEDEDTIDTLFPIAKAVLEEQNLTLKRTAIVLTVEGELPDFEDEDDIILADDDEEESEELQLLASFYYEEQEYAVYAPLDPCFILARIDEDNQPHLLSQEELKALEPMLETIQDQLLEDELE
jgi:hypothetical protein